MESKDYFILEKQEQQYKLNLLNNWNKETIPAIIKDIEKAMNLAEAHIINSVENIEKLGLLTEKEEVN